jgi:hypothetical protein
METIHHAMKPAAPLLLACLALAACKTPTVHLATPEPVKVDIAMRLDVYQHGNEPDQPPAAAKSGDPAKDRMNRLAEIQSFKNSRLVGENASALLSIRVDTPGDYGDYIRKTIEAENADRMALMKAEAAREKVPLPRVQKTQADLARKMAFKGEWIEHEKEDGTLEWTQKEG